MIILHRDLLSLHTLQTTMQVVDIAILGKVTCSNQPLKMCHSYKYTMTSHHLLHKVSNFEVRGKFSSFHPFIDIMLYIANNLRRKTSMVAHKNYDLLVVHN